MSEKHDHDHVQVVATTPGGDLLGVRCNHGEREIVQLRRTQDGQPIQGELMRLRKPEGESTPAGHYNVESLYKRPDSPAPAGPSKVATDAYRSGWDTIFGNKKATPSASN